MLCSWRMQTEWSSDPPQYHDLCPPMRGYLYSVSSRLFVLGATEGTTKGAGAPPTMPVYAIGIIPLLKIIKPKTPEDITMKHVAFAGELLELRRWWDTIDPWGPNVGT